ncbi:prepilin peptidase [Desulfurivibrio dismutans]|uniref:prepilin peptidase n=1 Tax=Desulfurivibrio dismutans TaxID=1398908 RepID=UPI0023DCB40D|nr:A24 family peptidase [Desulfurivibrio alkaliphilus]MDF1615398.1 prepilin peptidase [Desulfurivibrio alkaliphilus]
MEYPIPYYLLITAAVVLGAVVGSFLNVVILRLPASMLGAAENIIWPASRCPQCKTSLAWYDNIPIVSFVLLRRRCRACGGKISWRYPLVEAAMAGLALALLLRFGPTLDWLIYFIFSAALLAIFFIDLDHQLIPDVISLPGIAMGFAASFGLSGVTWPDAGLGIVLGGGTFYLVALGYSLATGREGMGGGDIKLLAMLGAFLGWQALPFIILASSLLGLVVGIGAMIRQGKGGRSVIPFGPFLITAAWLWLFFPEQIDQLWRLLFLP